MTAQKLNILGTEYKIIFEPLSSMRIKHCNGYCDFTVKEIHVNDFSEEEKEEGTLIDLKFYQNKVLRHEILHAFLYESGLYNNTKTDDDWARDETIIDWFAIQSPKIFKVFQELDIL